MPAAGAQPPSAVAQRLGPPAKRQRQHSPARDAASTVPPQPAPLLRLGNGPTLVLDLDETLVSCCLTGQSAGLADSFCITMVLDGKNIGTAAIRKRPHATSFLRWCIALFDHVVFWTAAAEEYAAPVIDQLLSHADCPGALVHRLYRGACTVQEDGSHVKDLSRVAGGRRNIWLLDDKPENCQLQPELHIPITPWEGDPEDTALLDLMPLLADLATGRDHPPTARPCTPPSLCDSPGHSPPSTPSSCGGSPRIVPRMLPLLTAPPSV